MTTPAVRKPPRTTLTAASDELWTWRGVLIFIAAVCFAGAAAAFIPLAKGTKVTGPADAFGYTSQVTVHDVIWIWVAAAAALIGFLSLLVAALFRFLVAAFPPLEQ